MKAKEPICYLPRSTNEGVLPKLAADHFEAAKAADTAREGTAKQREAQRRRDEAARIHDELQAQLKGKDRHAALLKKQQRKWRAKDGAQDQRITEAKEDCPADSEVRQ